MIEIRETPSGHPTVLLNGRFLHSSRDPLREAVKLTESLVRREPPCVVMLGFGLGYAGEQLLTGTEETQIIVFEPDVDLTRELRSVRSVETLLSSDRVHWCETLAELRDALGRWAATGFETVVLAGRTDSDIETFDEAQLALESFRSRIEINSNTLARFGRVWIRNLCRNVGVIERGMPVERLRNAFEGLPGLLLAAGPGLDQVLDDLPRLARHTVIVAVDTAVEPATRRGVEPDIAVVVDPQYWNARHLDAVRPGRTLLVSESSTHRSVFRHFAPPHHLCRSLFPLGQAIEGAIGDLGSLGTGGSVSTTAWDLVRFLGCRPIYVAGLDLGFPGGRTHFRGSFFEDLAVSTGDRLRPAENTIYRYVTSAAPFSIPSSDGGSVLTDKRMHLYLGWFERQLGATGCPPTYTLSVGGASITGMSSAGVETAASGPDIREVVDVTIESLRDVEVPDRSHALRSRLEAVVAELDTLVSYGRRAAGVLDAIESAYHAGDRVDFAGLALIDRQIRGASARAIAGFLMQEAIDAIRSGFGSGNIEEQLSASRRLYDSLVESADFHARSVREILQIKAEQTD